MFSYTQSNCKLQVYYMSTKNKFNLILRNHMFHSHSILNPNLPSLATELYNPKWITNDRPTYIFLLNNFAYTNLLAPIFY